MNTDMASPTYSPPSDSMQVFIVAVKAKLEELDVSQSELARRINSQPIEVSKLLRGLAGNCTLSRCDAIANALGTTTADLLNVQK